ncbi:alpha/beta hydrolase [Mesorhizobium comanense]|uniref:alpha/beta hydrolase n=1 Tax=Mesorhizobium comanense TaxID=2502215 RepID=UPI0014853217|nr:alpha/beta hydrolase [Mesorhizobium comanense]
MPVEGFTRGFGAGAPVLVVILHGWRSTPQGMADVVQASREALGEAGNRRVDTYVPKLAYHRALGTRRAVDIVLDILRDIDALVAEEPAYERIVLTGHSMGATIARRVFLVAAGCPPGFRTEDEFAGQPRREWSARVDRIILMAAFNRGWQISQRLSWRYSIGLNICGLLGHTALKDAWVPTIFDIRMGAPFMVQTRLHWLAYRRHCLASGAASRPEPVTNQPVTNQPATGQPATSPAEPMLIQIIGSRDDLISPFDQVDITVDGNASGNRTYFLIQFDDTDHKSAVRFTGSGDDAAVASARRERFVTALTGTTGDIAEVASNPDLLIDEIDKPDVSVKHTVFVIHGIRDDGFWTHRIAEKVREAANAPVSFRAWTPTYGYFAMLPFVLPWVRRLKAEWFMDQYVSAVAQYPNSQFHYVGHSNGTYLAARGLADYPACAFGNVFFAGSVVRSDYDWKTPVRDGRVARLLNVVASKDWVVALLPKGLQWIPGTDVGGAGFDGFRQADAGPAAETDPAVRIVQREYVEGSHSAGIAEAQWPGIANFVVDGIIPSDRSAGFIRKQPLWLKLLSDSRAVPVLLVAVFVVFLPALIVCPAFDVRVAAIGATIGQQISAFLSQLNPLAGRMQPAALFISALLSWLSFGDLARAAVSLISALLSWVVSFGGTGRATLLFLYILLVKFVVTRV